MPDLRLLLQRRLPAVAGGLGLAAAAMVAWALHQHIVPGSPGRGWEAWLVFGLGGLAAMLLTALLAQQQRARASAESETQRLSADVERLALVVQHTFDAVLVTDLSQCITWANAGFERLTGWRLEEVRGQRPGPLLQTPETDRPTLARLRATLAAGEVFVGELLNRHRNGTPYWIEITIQPVRDARGVHTGFMAITRDITAAREATRALATERRRLQRIIEATQAGTWECDLVTGQERINPRYAELLGYSIDEMELLMRRTFLDLVHPDDVETVARARSAHLHGLAREYRAEFRMQHRAGHWVWLSSRGLVVERDASGAPLAMAGIHLDISARRKAQDEVQRSAQVLRSAIDAIDEAFVLYDADDRLVLCNEKYREIYAASAEAIVPGARFEDILRHGLARGQYPAARGREAAWLAERMAQHRRGDATVVQHLSDGRTVRVIERRTPDGFLVGFRVDITELVRAKEAAEQADRAKSDFIATISHELRTPLQSVIGFSELGQHFAADHPRFRAMFEDTLAGGRRMLTLVNALLDVSKIDATGSSISTAPADLAALADAVVHEMRPMLDARELQVRLPSPLPALPVRVNAFRMQQVLRNLLANAIRFAPQGSCIDIECGLTPDAGTWLQVRDRGPGIPPDELQAVFEPFVQSSRTRDGAGGTGLGLTICRRIMRAHGGGIEAANADGGGAVMRLWLPAAPPSQAGSPAAVADSLPPDAPARAAAAAEPAATTVPV